MSTLLLPGFINTQFRAAGCGPYFFLATGTLGVCVISAWEIPIFTSSVKYTSIIWMREFGSLLTKLKGCVGGISSLKLDILSLSLSSSVCVLLVYGVVHMWRSENNFYSLLPLLHESDLWFELSSSGVCGKCFYLLRRLACLWVNIS